MQHLKVFGSPAFSLTPKGQLKKFDTKASKLVLVGYEEDSTNYRLFNPSTRKVTVARHVTFNEDKQPTPATKEKGDDEELFNPDSSHHENAEDEGGDNIVEEVRLIEEEVKQAKPPEVSPPILEQPVPSPRALQDRQTLRKPARFDALCAFVKIPTTFTEATSGPDADTLVSSPLREAINRELQAHQHNDT